MNSRGLFLFAASAAICFGQGSISGKVLTAAGNGAAIPGAPVQAMNLQTKQTYRAASAADGSYTLSGLPVRRKRAEVPGIPSRRCGGGRGES